MCLSKKYHRECFTLISAYEGKPTGFGETKGELVCFSFSSPFDTCWLVQGAFWDTWLSQVHTSHLSASSVNGADQNHIWGFEVDMARCKLWIGTVLEQWLTFHKSTRTQVQTRTHIEKLPKSLSLLLLLLL